jgi:hypothetical protein
MIGGAGRGDEARILELRDMLNQNAQHFLGRGVNPGIVGGLEAARPQAIAQAKRDAEQQKREEEFWRDEEKRQKEAEAAQRKADAEEAQRQRKADADQAKADAEEEKRFGGVADAFGDSTEEVAREGLGRGQAPEAVAADVYQFAREGGASVNDAFRVAAEAVREAMDESTREANEVAAELAAQARQNAINSQMRQQWLRQQRGQNPWRNGRPNGL